jgi:geranylgeranyl reductase family protein
MQLSMFRDNARPVDWQLSLSELIDQLWDVLVIGAGPAGSTAAFHLSRKGYRVVMLDMGRFPREKVCGDCLITDVDANLASLGLRELIGGSGMELRGITIFSPSRSSFTVRGSFVTLRRPVLDSILAHNAVQAGASFALGQVTSLTTNRDETVTAVCRGKNDLIRAKIAILATGTHIGLARRLGLVVSDKPSAIAMRCYVTSSHKLDRLVLSYERRILPGYGWLVPLGDGKYNVGCGYFLQPGRKMGLRDCFEAFIGEFPLARQLMQRARIVSPPRSGALRCGLQGAHPVFGRSIIAVGETIGTTFPLTGEGVGQAMMTGAMAAAVISEALKTGNRDELKEYLTQLESALRPRHSGFLHARRWVSRSWLNNFMGWRVRRSKYLQQACANFLANSSDPRQVYSLRAVLKSFLM